MSKNTTMRKQHTSMRGKKVDMDLLRKRNELTPAVGNAKVNARGDELGAGGQIVRKREEIIKEYYNQVGVARGDSGRAKPKAADEVIAAEEAAPTTAKKTTRTTKKQEPKTELTPEEKAMFEEAAQEDEWIEDENGNFVQKGE
jgi:hypothetical protein